MTTTILGGNSSPLIECDKPIASIDDVRQDDKAAQRNTGIEIRRRYPLLLTSIRTGEELCAGLRKTNQLLVREILDSLIDQVQIHVDIRAYSFLTEACDRRQIRVRRRGR